MKHYERNATRLLRPAPVLVVESWFLQDLVLHLHQTGAEDIVYITGPQVGYIRVLSRICLLDLEHQSMVRATASALETAKVLRMVHEHGNRPHVMAHSHPGRGAEATTPSGRDRRYLSSVQEAGAEVIGIITAADGYVRFWTERVPFRVVVRGNHWKQIEPHVYHVSIPPMVQANPSHVTDRYPPVSVS